MEFPIIPHWSVIRYSIKLLLTNLQKVRQNILSSRSKFELCKSRLSVINCKFLILSLTMIFRIVILKDSFEVIYTGLRRVIGSPQDYAKNRSENNFPTNFDLSVPLDETDQHVGQHPSITQQVVAPQNINRNRVEAQPMQSNYKKQSSNYGPKIELPED